VSSCLIGSCTNSSYEDMAKCAKLVEQALAAGLKFKTPFYVTPGSAAVALNIKKDGFIDLFERAGGVVLAQACGPCIGQWRRKMPPGVKNTIVTSYNRNFAKRNDGNADTHAFVTSPELTTMLAFAGTLDFDPLTQSLDVPGKGSAQKFSFSPPAEHCHAMPPSGWSVDPTIFQPPSERLPDGKLCSAVPIQVSAQSSRLQLLAPFPKWDGEEYAECAVLLKAAGKCTTDHISMAGPWLKYRGHLTNISENMLIGAVNAESGATNAVHNRLSGSVGKVPEVARAYREAGLKWVVIGDQNYGEGSSREHAALEPRHLGGVAVVVRSFARIHETNLKKQGMLPLTFKEAGDYERVGPRDSVGIFGLKSFAPGVPLTLRVSPAGGGEVFDLVVEHTFNEEQIGWFKAGSALNKMKEDMKMKK